MNHQTKNESARSHGRFTVIIICLSLSVLIWLAFNQAIHFGFINFDDDVYVYKNPHVTGGLTRDGAGWAFTHIHSSNWHPLTWLSHMLDVQLFGLNAGGHHFTNILIHILTTILLFLVLHQLTGFLWRSAFVAAVFAVHPLRVESVAWIAERKDVLSAFFFILTVVAYIRYTESNWSLRRYLLVVLIFCLALMSKPMVVTLPFVLLLLDFWPLKRFTPFEFNAAFRRCLIEKIPLLALSAGMCAITVFAQQGAVSPLPLSLRLENAAVSSVIYLRQLIFPSGLAVLYPFPEHGLPQPEMFFAIYLLIAISLAAFFTRNKYPWLLFGWLWYLGMLVPVIGILQVGAQAHADRYTHLPQIGLLVAIIWTVAEISTRWQRRRLVLSTVSVVILVLLTISARNQTAYWRNSETLWTHALAFTSDNIVAQNNLGNALLDAGKLDEAMTHFKSARHIKPEDAKAAFNFGNALIQNGELTQGIVNLEQAVRLDPDYAEAHINLGGAFLKTGKVDDAISHFQKALQLQPYQPAAWNDLGYAYLRKGAADKATECFKKAMEIDPEQPVAQNNIANALMQQGKVDQAVEHYKKALRLKPDYAEAEYNLGTALVQKHDLNEAVAHFQRALKLKSDYASAAYNIGVAFFHEDKVTEAAAYFQKAIQINPDYAEAHYNLGNALVRQEKIDDAIAEFRKALKIEPDQILTRNNLGYILLHNGKTDEAMEEFKKVLQEQPDNPDAHFNLGSALIQKGYVDAAAAHFQQALQREPGFAEAHYGLGTVLVQKGNEAEALAQFRKAIQLKPDYSEALNDLAWELATAPQSADRDGNSAVELAQKADRLTGSRDPDILDTIAAAYAESHRFEEAVHAARQAIELARSSGQDERMTQLNTELALYESGHPFHRDGK